MKCECGVVVGDSNTYCQSCGTHLGASKEAAAALKTKERKKIIKKTLIITAVIAIVVGAALIVAYALALIGPPRHTIEFMLNDGTNSKHIEDITFRGEGTVNAPNDPIREGYAFLFWATSPTAGRQVNLPTSLDESLTLYAQWIAEHLVIIHLNDGTDTVLSEFIVHDGDTIEMPAEPEKYGHAFVHWTTDQPGNQPFAFYTPVTNHLRLYAQWIAERRVSFLLNDGTDSTHDEIVIKDGEIASQPSAPSRQGYAFTNWTADIAGNTIFDFSIPVTSDVTIYAQWIPLRTVTINKNYAGASSITPQILVDGSTVSQVSVPNRQGFDFIHWTSDAAGEHVVTPENVITTNIALYAQWQRIPLPLNEAAPMFETGTTGSFLGTPPRVDALDPMDLVQIQGNTHTNAIVYSSVGFTLVDNPMNGAFSLHQLNSQFDTLVVRIGRVDGTVARNATLEVRGDNQVLLSSEIEAYDAPSEFSIPVTGVNVLRIDVIFPVFRGDTAEYAIIAYLS